MNITRVEVSEGLSLIQAVSIIFSFEKGSD